MLGSPLLPAWETGAPSTQKPAHTQGLESARTQSHRPSCFPGLIPSLSPLPNLYVHQVHHRNHEHPHEIDKVPVEGPDFEIVRVIAAAFISNDHDEQGDRPAEDVR